MNSDTAVLTRLRDFLAAEGVTFREIEHEATLTSEESARARGEELRMGGKALVVKVDECFRLFVLPADRRFVSGAVKKQFSARKVRFATREELLTQTGLVPGSVPPFGNPILPYDLFADFSLRENERIAFNAGSLTTSLILSMDDYLRVANPSFLEFASHVES